MSIAALAGGAALAAAAGLFFFAGAIANPMTGDTNAEEIFANRSESFVDLNEQSGPGQMITDEEALTSAVRVSSTPATVEWAQASAGAVEGWAKPGAAAVQSAAARWEPRLGFAANDHDDRFENRLSLEFGQGGGRKNVQGTRYQRLADSMGVPAAFTESRRSKGRWFLFAATGGDAVGMNMLRGRDGELRRSSWSAEKIAAVGDAQLGFGWRKGPLQASVAFVQREISVYGRSEDEKFVAFTFSVRPQGAKTRGGQRDYWLKRAESYSGRQPAGRPKDY